MEFLKASHQNAGNISCSDILRFNTSEPICDDNDVLKNTSGNPDLVEFLYSYARSNTAVINIFISNPYYTRIIRDQEIPFVIFLGNAGGVVGILMGLSLISCFEIFYYFMNFLYLKAQATVFKGPTLKARAKAQLT